MIKIASTMHDLGKIAIPDAILKKPGKLTLEEFEVIKQHPTSGYKILNKSELPALRLAAEIALYHHEKYDGTGYPAQKSNLDIPKSARMMAIIDVFDAMSHKRIYKEAASMEETLAFINSQKGKHFDPDLVDLFMSNLDYITENMK